MTKMRWSARYNTYVTAATAARLEKGARLRWDGAKWVDDPDAPDAELTDGPTDGPAATAADAERAGERLAPTADPALTPGTDTAAGDGDTEGEAFDPTTHKVAEVQAYLEAHPDDTDRVIAAEKAGPARKSIVGD